MPIGFRNLKYQTAAVNSNRRLAALQVSIPTAFLLPVADHSPPSDYRSHHSISNTFNRRVERYIRMASTLNSCWLDRFRLFSMTVSLTYYILFIAIFPPLLLYRQSRFWPASGRLMLLSEFGTLPGTRRWARRLIHSLLHWKGQKKRPWKRIYVHPVTDSLPVSTARWPCQHTIFRTHTSSFRCFF